MSDQVELPLQAFAMIELLRKKDTMSFPEFMAEYEIVIDNDMAIPATLIGMWHLVEYLAGMVGELTDKSTEDVFNAMREVIISSES